MTYKVPCNPFSHVSQIPCRAAGICGTHNTYTVKDTSLYIRDIMWINSDGVRFSIYLVSCVDFDAWFGALRAIVRSLHPISKQS